MAPERRRQLGALQRGQRHWNARVTRHTRHWPVSVRGMLWATLAGITLCALNVASRVLSMNLDVYQAMCMRYIASLVLIVPFLLRLGWAGFKPVSVRGQLLRGGICTGNRVPSIYNNRSTTALRWANA